MLISLSIFKKPPSLSSIIACQCTMTRLRKLQKEEGQRRSPRISALEASCMRRHLDKGQGPAFRTRGKKKKKLKPLQVTTSASASSNQGVKVKRSPQDQPLKLPPSTLPEKRILELVLDTLQRRDSYEIFAEPVDPNEVEDYYAIIKEPMDFGTMRAKLHEGMYETLEQFEHDVFLIFNNAMHFNSSGTIYFRQARVINELAKKVFDVLKNNPEKFEMEFSETRQKVGWRNEEDFRDSTFMKSSEITTSVPSKNVSCSSRGTSKRKSFRTNHGCSDTAKHVEVPRGTKGSGRCKSLEVDRRSTYRPLSIDEDESIFSTVYDKLKLLEYVGQQDIGYRDSLMLFVKDLGPTVQNIAKKKLLGCEIRTASASVPWRPNTTASALMPQYPLNHFLDHPNEMRIPREKIDMEIAIRGETVERTLNAEREKGFSPLEGNHRWSLRSNKVFPNQNFCYSHYSQDCPEDMNCLDHVSRETGKKYGMMLSDKSKLVHQEQMSVSILENYQTNVLESRLKNNCMFQSQPWPLESSNVSCLVQDKSQCPTNEISCSSKTMTLLKSDQTVPVPPSFVFNLPYLKTRLDQINSSEQHRFLQLDSSGKKRLFSS